MTALAFVFVLGLCFGSFFAASSWRFERWFYSQDRKKHPFSARIKLALFEPSKCPCCHSRLSWWQLIPLLGPAAQKFRCQKCKCRIDPLYSLQEIFFGFMFVGLYLHAHQSKLARYLDEYPVWVLPEKFLFHAISAVFALFTVWACTLMARIDMKYYSIDIPVVVFAWLCYAGWLVCLHLGADVTIDAIYRDMLASLASVGIFWIIWLLSGGRLGSGDVWLASVTGLVAGWDLALVVFNGAFVSASLFGVGQIYLTWRRARQGRMRSKFRASNPMKMKLPLGVFLCWAAIAKIIWQIWF